MGATFVDPVEVTPGSASTWTSVDSALVPDTASGVILHLVNNHATTGMPTRSTTGIPCLPSVGKLGHHQAMANSLLGHEVGNPIPALRAPRQALADESGYPDLAYGWLD
jgi:hypothetical protein